MDFPGVPAALPLFVSTWSRYGPQAFPVLAGGAAASMTWPVANTAFYYPAWLPWPYPVRRVWWINGSSVTSTNMDFGIYTADGTLIYSTGSTAGSGTSAVQYVTPSPDFVLPAGRYYFALADSSSTTNRGGHGSTSVPASAARARLMGVLQEANALPLPATMTPAAVANVCMAMCGITRTAGGF